MRAALFSEHGGPEVIRIAEAEMPEPGSGEVRVPVRAVMPLDDARRAHELLEAGEVFGKLVLVP